MKALKEAVNSLERGDKKAEKAQEDVSKNLVSNFIAFPRIGNTSFDLLLLFELLLFYATSFDYYILNIQISSLNIEYKRTATGESM